MVDQRVPKMGRGRRMPVAEQERVGAELRKRYDAGQSIRELCSDTGYSIGRVRRLLQGAGVTFRARGGATRRS
jgi:hypothetical protein